MQNNELDGFLFILHNASELLQEKLPVQPVLTRGVSSSVQVDLGSGVGISFPAQSKKVILLKRGQIYPEALPTSTTVDHGEITTTAVRTAIGMESLEDLLEEFPDSIKQTITELLDSK